MKKRILLLVAVIGVLLTMAAISVSADVFFNEDFSDPEFVNDSSKFTYSISATPSGNQVTEIAVITEDADVTGDGVADKIAGTLHMQNTSTSGDATGASMTFLFPAEAKAGSPDSVFLFDLMMPDVTSCNKSRMSAMIYYGGVRNNSYFSSNSMTGPGESGTKSINYTTVAGEWYTYMYRLNSDRTIIEIYRKLQSEPASEFVNLGYFFTGDHNKVPSFMWVASKSQQVNMYFDNMRFYNGSNVIATGFDMDGEKVETVSQITEGELSADVEILTATEKSGLTKVLLACDSKGKLLGCTVIDEESTDIAVGANNISAQMELDEASAQAIADGGYVGFYLWDIMYPVISPLELR